MRKEFSRAKKLYARDNSQQWNLFLPKKVKQDFQTALPLHARRKSLLIPVPVSVLEDAFSFQFFIFSLIKSYKVLTDCSKVFPAVLISMSMCEGFSNGAFTPVKSFISPF